jgi:hypothetical protein
MSGAATEDDQAKKSEGRPMAKEWGEQAAATPKATFDIRMAKYKEGRADIMGHKNRTIWNTNPDSLFSLSLASTSAARSSFDKRSRTP